MKGEGRQGGVVLLECYERIRYRKKIISSPVELSKKIRTKHGTCSDLVVLCRCLSML